MLESTFYSCAKGGYSINFIREDIGNWTLWQKPYVLVNNATGEKQRFKSLQDALENGIVNGKTLKEIIRKADPDILKDKGENWILDDNSLVIRG